MGRPALRRPHPRSLSTEWRGRAARSVRRRISEGAVFSLSPPRGEGVRGAGSRRAGRPKEQGRIERHLALRQNFLLPRSSYSSMTRVYPVLPPGVSLVAPSLLRAQPAAPEALHITKATAPIEVDGELGDPGWSGATRVDTFYETNPGDNVRAEGEDGRLAHLRRPLLLRGLRLLGPRPEGHPRPLGDHDDVPSYTDYGGVILDTRNDGKTAFMFLANPRGIQYDAISSDASGEDNSPDFFWDSAARITPTAGRWRSASRSRRCATTRPTRRPGASCSTATGRATSATRCSTAKLPRGSTASSATSRRSPASTGCPPATTSCSRPTPRAPGVGAPDGGPRHPAGGASRRLGRRARRQVDAERRHGHRRHDQPRLLADRVGRGADLGQRALRPLLPREAAVLPRGARPVLDADPGGLHAHHHLAALGRCGPPARSAAPSTRSLVAEDRGGGSVILPGPNGSGLRRPGLLLAGGDRPRAARLRQLVRELPGHRPRDRGGRPQPRARPRLPVAARTAHDTVTGQFLVSDTADPEPPRPRRRSGTAGTSAPTPATLNWSTTPAPGTGSPDIQGLRRRLPRRPRLPAAGRGAGRASPCSGRVVPPRARGRSAASAPTSGYATSTATDGAACSCAGSSPASRSRGAGTATSTSSTGREKVRAGDRLFDSDYFVINLRRSAPRSALGDVFARPHLGDDVDFANAAAGPGAPRSACRGRCGPPTTWRSSSTAAGAGSTSRPRAREPRRAPVHGRRGARSRPPTPSPPAPSCG